MTREDVFDLLKANADAKYKIFHEKLIPGTENILGVRMPNIKLIAKEIIADQGDDYFSLDYTDTHEEKMLRGLVIAGKKNIAIERRLELLDEFVPKIDTWAICDTTCSALKVTKKHPKEMLTLIDKYIYSEREFESRFAIVMLLSYYITDQYIDLTLDYLQKVDTSQYYVMMAVAWALSFCYIKQKDKTLPLFENNVFDKTTHNKAIQKTIESLRVSEDDKQILRKQRIAK